MCPLLFPLPVLRIVSVGAVCGRSEQPNALPTSAVPFAVFFGRYITSSVLVSSVLFMLRVCVGDGICCLPLPVDGRVLSGVCVFCVLRVPESAAVYGRLAELVWDLFALFCVRLVGVPFVGE